MSQEINYSVKAEVAVEIISMYIAIAKEDNLKDIEKILRKEREEIYLGNEKIIEKVINEYGNIIKKRLGK